MTCKDCIHEKVCDALIKSGCPYLDEEVPADAFCIEFRNTADVVPKSEYDEVLSNWQKIHDSYTADCIDHYNKGRQEVAREIFEEIDKVTMISRACEKRGIPFDFGEFFAEFKKKYVESEKC